MSLDRKTFNASVSDIKELVTQGVRAEHTLQSTRGLYFRALIGTTQARGGDGATLRAVHQEFYAVVLEAVVTPDIAKASRVLPEEKKRRARERNRRSNFARSAYGTIRRWLSIEGHDLMSLKPAKVTKTQLMAETPTRVRKPLSEDKAAKRCEALMGRVLDFTRTLAASRPDQARKLLDEAINRAVQELARGAITPTTDAAAAQEEHRPLRIGKTLFWPTETQILRRERLKRAA